MQRSTSLRRRVCAIGTTIAVTGLMTGAGLLQAASASADTVAPAPAATSSAAATPSAAATGTATGTPTASASPSATATPTATASPTATATPTIDPSAVGRAAKHHPLTSAATPAATDPATPAPTATATPTPAAGPTVTISGDTAVGSTVTAGTKGFTGHTLSFAWTVDGTPSTDTGSSFDIDSTMGGKTITVTVTSEVPGEQATASITATVPPVLVDAAGKPLTTGLSADDPVELTTTAGQPWSYTFHATGTPTPTLRPAYFDPSEADNGDGYTPADDFPDSTTFDASTGTISGAPEQATYYDFAVSATSGTKTVTEYVELTVNPAAPLGVEVQTADKAEIDSQANPSKEWVIDPDGKVYTLTISLTDEGGTFDFEPGGQPTVKQGGTLLVAGDLVDKYGNEITDADGNPAPTKVTSNVASDVIGYSEQDGSDTVTFPHASTHRISVAAETYSTAFDVVVTPVAAPVAVVSTTTAKTSTVGAQELAYTGSESTKLVPWALGLLAAGVGLSVAQVVRHRRSTR